METMKNVNIIFKAGLNSLVKTFWAIGTSIASAGVLHYKTNNKVYVLKKELK